MQLTPSQTREQVQEPLAQYNAAGHLQLTAQPPSHHGNWATVTLKRMSLIKGMPAEMTVLLRRPIK